MTKFKSSLATAGTLLVLGLMATPANALATRTFVSGNGTDSGTCARATPCRNFAYAITQTAPHGEIAVLDTAGYGTVTISQSISIVNPGGVEAGIAASGGGTAITITGLATGDIVALRGLTIEGAQSGAKGIFLNSGGTVEIDNCVVRGFTVNAIDIEPLTGTTTTFRISNSIAAANGHDGLLVSPAGNATVQGVIDHLAASGNANNGIALASGGGAVNVSITNSVASSNLSTGIYVTSAFAKVTVSNTTASNNGTGINANTSATVQLTQSLVAGNSTGVVVATSGVVDTYSDNNINFNATQVSGSLTPITAQ